MSKINIRYIIGFFFCISALVGNTFKSEAQIVVEPLFEYPTAPEEMESITERCDFIVTNFWNKFDFKQKSTVDQNALNDAMNVYLTSIYYGSEIVGKSEYDKLVEKVSKNPVLLTQFLKAAEENLYGNRAEFWNDSMYLKMLEAYLKNKKIPESRKSKYQKQYDALKVSQIGLPMPEFDFLDKNKEPKRYFPMSTPTLLLFGDPSQTEWRMARLKMETNLALTEALEKGKVNIIYIVSVPSETWQSEVSNYSSKWTLGQSDSIGSQIDVRVLPTLYLVGSEGNIILKNVSLEAAVTALLDLVNLSN